MTTTDANGLAFTRPTTETDVLVLVPGQYTPSVSFRAATALAACTMLDNLPDGRLVVARNWPQLSSGEERLWSVLQWLNGQASYPDMADLRAHLDADNYAAVVKAVQS